MLVAPTVTALLFYASTPAIATCTASTGTPAIPAAGATVTCDTVGGPWLARIGDGTTAATVNLDPTAVLDTTVAGTDGIRLQTAIVTLGDDARINAAGVGINGAPGGVTVTLGTNAQINAVNGNGVMGNAGFVTANLGAGAQVNANGANRRGISTTLGNMSVTLGAGAQINANGGSGIGISSTSGAIFATLGAGAQINANGVSGTGISTTFGTASVTLGAGSQINATGTYGRGIYSKYSAALTLQSGSQINAAGSGFSTGFSNINTTVITLDAGSSIISTGGTGILGGQGADTINLSGLVQGGTNSLNLRAGDDTLILQTGSNLVGPADGGSGNDTVILLGVNTEDENFINFENLIMNGTAWTLSGTSTFATNATLNFGILTNSGILTVPVTINSGATFSNMLSQTGDVTVNAGGLFMGTGTTTGNVFNNGTVAPGVGGIIGTQTVTGNFTQGAGGSFDIDVDSGGATDLLNISGAAALSGNLSLASSGGIPNGTVYTIMQAAGGVTGNFNTVTDNLFSVNFTVEVNPTDVQVTANRTLATAGQTSTERNLAQILDQAIASGAAGTAAIDTSLNGLSSPRQISDFLASASNLIGLAAIHSAMTGMADVSNIVLSRLNSAPLKPKSHPAPDAPTPESFPALISENVEALNSIAPAAGGAPVQGNSSVWLQGTGGVGSVSGDTIARGNDYNSAGLAAGVEVATDFDARLGVFVAATQTRSEVDGLRDVATTDTYLIGAYGNWQPSEAWTLKGSLSGGWLNFETERPTLAGTAMGDFSGYGGFGYFEAAYKTFETDNSYVAPLLALEGSLFQHQGYQETGAGALNLTVDKATSAQLKILLGTKLAADFETPPLNMFGALRIASQFQGAWAHEFLDKYPDVQAQFSGVPSTSYENGGPSLDRDSARFSVNLAVSPVDKDYLTFYAGYDLNISQDTNNNHITGGFRLRW